MAGVTDVEKVVASFEANIERDMRRSVSAWTERLRTKIDVRIRRTNQFALVQPSTKTRIDAGPVGKGRPPTSRLMIRLASVRDANADRRVRHSQASLHRSNRRNLIRPPI